MKQLPIDLVLQNELCTVIWLVCWQLDTHTSRFPPEKKKLEENAGDLTSLLKTILR